MKVPIWEGVYESFQEVPATGPGFRGEAWIRNSLKKSRFCVMLRKRTRQYLR
jgi:hypothetical protein